MRRRMSRRSKSTSRRRPLFWDGIWVLGPLSTMHPVNIEAGNRYALWARYPAGMIDTNDPDETGITRSGLILPIDVTLERTRVSCTGSIAGLAGNECVNIGLGITVAEDHNPAANDNVIFNAGSGTPIEFPSPTLDANEDWVWRIIQPVVGFGGGSPIFWSGGNGVTDLYQSRAKRKLKAGQGLMFLLDYTSSSPEGSELDFNLCFDVRMIFRSGAYRT
jgi:hypothetical protein